MRFLLMIPMAIAIGVYACIPKSHTATAVVADGITLSMTIRPMFGWHSDWHRKLVFSTPDGSFKRDLFEDTGWWRGSNLYQHRSGSYLLHEGQAGCIALPIAPADAEPGGAVSCEKSAAASANSAPNGQDEKTLFPPSIYYESLFYIGHFAEKPKGSPALDFIPANALPEPELPDPL